MEDTKEKQFVINFLLLTMLQIRICGGKQSSILSFAAVVITTMNERWDSEGWTTTTTCLLLAGGSKNLGRVSTNRYGHWACKAKDMEYILVVLLYVLCMLLLSWKVVQWSEEKTGWTKVGKCKTTHYWLLCFVRQWKPKVGVGVRSDYIINNICHVQ